MLTYATFSDYARVKKITDLTAQQNAERVITDYLRRATDFIDSACGRYFFPLFETRQMSIPVQYIDLNNRAMIYDDLPLDNDLIEPQSVFTGAAGGNVDTLDTLAVGVNRYAEVLTVGDVDGLDASGVTRFLANRFILIDSEYMRVVSVDTSTNKLIVQRGVLNTLAAAHTAGTAIYRKPLSTLAIGIDVHPLDFNLTPHYALRLEFPNSWAGGILGANYRYQSPQLLVQGYWGYREQYSRAWVDTLETVKDGAFGDAFSSAFTTAGINREQTTLTVSDADGTDDWGISPRFEAGMLLRLDDELISVSSVDVINNTITVRRGVQGTTALAHDAGIPVLRYAVQQDVVEACIAIASTWREADDSKGGRQGVSDMSQGVPISMPEDVTKILTRLQKLML